MYLYLARHGEARRKEQDPERPLTEAGSETARRVAALLRASGLSVGGIHHSTKLRARQTAEILAAGGGLVAPVTQVPNLEPLAEVDGKPEGLRWIKERGAESYTYKVIADITGPIVVEVENVRKVKVVPVDSVASVAPPEKGTPDANEAE